ncbi:beta-ketoacyl-[acyl-carrier-protein] synthase II [Moraxella osloensis]|uniref:3-oxoacyl-[acyl-carrier-protein] synthase 2 n=1 Tax=Faucicola osloensis TaxID=34062 RepID=A0A378QGG9_FAUOS|nr:beta-ketoacyl-ACP synthase II [Moraxella osloensis]AME01615.1 beta-ketoacyl-[acyl-carrier-protein] synthase II [Moraxella osloensis]OBX56383.1 beta-ketoacyl-[acyl-carrier-protein] synthase II [Moraxella osloensis]QPT42654.1 beta-ketoacyl-ACP synthase II [Moraxella osloensis]STY98337.1 3-oxoacyl-[acyl-carrier-protein] synthase 2 [Moraxella osloensis]
MITKFSQKKPRYDERPDHERIVITGMGAITPLGLDVESTWQRLINGESGIKAISHFDATDYRAQIAGTVDGFDIGLYMNAKDARRYDTFVQYGVAAAAQALKQAGFISELQAAPVQQVDPNRIGVIIGSGIGGITTIEDTAVKLHSEGPRKISPFFVPSAIVNMAAGQVAIRHGIKGLNLATSTACTTATHAIGLAARLIAYGDVDVIVAGGCEKASSQLGIGGFSAMQALSTRNDAPTKASRPFDKDRDGFVLGDGAGVLVMESLAHAKARGATILAEFVGFGMSDDASHITAPPENGEGAAMAMRHALSDAGIAPSDVGYINTHGTSTPAGDVAESRAIAGIFGENMVVSSTKSMTGHLLGAAGGIEAIFTVKALQQQILPPTINLDHQDPECKLDYVPHTARKVDGLTHAISNSFGFGGTNGSLLFAKWQ